MQTIKVVKVEEKHSKDGSKTFYVLHDDTGAEFTTFETGVKAGDVIEGDIKFEGKYVNLQKGFKIVGTVPIAPKVETPTPKTEYKPENKNSSYSLSYAKDLCTAGKIEVNEICPVAEYFDRFLEGKIQFSEVQIIKALKLAVEKPKEASQDTPKVTSPPLQGVEGELPEFKDGIGLVNYALEHGWKVEAVKKALGIKMPTDIKDVKSAAAVLFGGKVP